jgi:hypothetical protein
LRPFLRQAEGKAERLPRQCSKIRLSKPIDNPRTPYIVEAPVMRIRNFSGYQMGLTIGVCKVSWLRSTKTAGIVCILLSSSVLLGDRPISKEPVTITFVDPEWSKDLTDSTLVTDDRLKDFTLQTGIGVKHLPTPETTLDQLDLVRKLLRQASTSPDVDGVDVIWPGVLSEELMDLKPYLATELPSINHWIGWISPRSVTSLQEWDAINDFYHAGTSAFFRGWARSYLLSIRDIPSIQDQIGMTNIPAGKNAQATTLGGFGLGISRSSRHTTEALQLIQFLVQREFKLEEARSDHQSRNGQESYDPTAILRTNRNSAGNGKQPVSGAVARPSTVAGEKYEEVSRAYIQAVRSVLLGQSRAPEAAASLELELVRITGFKPGPPGRNRVPKEKSLGTVSGSRPAAGSTGASRIWTSNR